MMDLLQSSVIFSNSDKDEFFEGILGGERFFCFGNFPQLLSPSLHLIQILLATISCLNRCIEHSIHGSAAKFCVN